MKKLIILILSFLLISCFTEPKKENETYNFTIENTNNINNTRTDDSNIKDVNKENVISIENTIIDNNKISIKTLISIIDKSADTFENFAVKNGYHLDEVKDYEYFKVIYYKKPDSFFGFAVNKYDNSSMEIVNLETKSKEMYLSMKEESLNLGFKYEETKTFDKRVSDNDRIYNKYTNGKYDINFIISNNSENLGYSIAIEKSKKQ